jgi:hypothetical protein
MGFVIGHSTPTPADRPPPAQDRLISACDDDPPRQPPRSLLATPSAIIDPTGVMVPRAAAGIGLPATRRARHSLLVACAALVLGFAVMHLLFVGGPQGGPLLPLSAPAGMEAEKPPLALRQAKRAHTQPHEPTVTGTHGPAPEALGATHPLPPPRPRRI